MDLQRRWNSRSVCGWVERSKCSLTEDHTYFVCFIATGGWPEQENPHATRIGALLEYHKILASRERQQCERKKFHPKRTYMQFVRRFREMLRWIPFLFITKLLSVSGKVWNVFGHGAKTRRIMSSASIATERLSTACRRVWRSRRTSVGYIHSAAWRY